MSKSEKVREYIRAHPGALMADIAAATGLPLGAFVSTICGQMVKRGHLVRDSSGGLTLNADYLRGARRSPGKRLAEKVRGNREHLRAQRRAKKSPPKTLRDVVRKHLTPVVQNRNPLLPFVSHVGTALAAFGETIDTESLNEMSRTALRSLGESVTLLETVAAGAGG